MKNPIFSKQYIKEYFLYGTRAALFYIVPVIYFLYHHSYENLYVLYLGCMLFMAGIFLYCYRLLFHRYTEKRAVSVMIAGLLTTFAGIAVCIVFAVIAMLFAFPGLLHSMPPNSVIKDAPATIETTHPGRLLVMILATAILGNFLVGSFISIITSYANKKDQTKEKATPLEPHVSSNVK